ncbi:hypothetical protein JAAARDRAFT_191290 [Jaapia argillacea MUCL 33604]|uniref:Nascent polypeptide-associated complex subunit alpha-like UBA domain-containing protein n=1 Tax=Jaapia argillacea MUCL 33604 TaxID=933084 RepID=A0A067Q4U6_9AGAM|nr:hypothetical protein JAAARDRAFT_191290 [Jaapia argillacea MUCL 33604]
MSLSRNSNGRPEPEVIVNFIDGYSYSKGKMEEAFRSGLFDKPTKSAKESVPLKKDDIDLIVSEFDLLRPQAEKILTDHGGDITKALGSLVAPQIRSAKNRLK